MPEDKNLNLGISTYFLISRRKLSKRIKNTLLQVLE